MRALVVLVCLLLLRREFAFLTRGGRHGYETALTKSFLRKDTGLKDGGKIYAKRDTYDSRLVANAALVLDDFDLLLDAIVIFKKLYGEKSEIPARFEVPVADDWPSSLHGLRLGRRLERILSSKRFFDEYPDKVELLRKSGVTPNLNSLIDEWDLVYECIEVYKAKYGDLRIPNKFVVPDEEPWPKLYRNMRLGIRIAAIRSSGRHVRGHPERKAALDAIGFEWRLRENTYKQQINDDIWDTLYDSLVAYKNNIDEDINYVPASFAIPENDENWPEKTWGFKLGSQLQSIREDGKLIFNQNEREQQLLELGFAWEVTGRRQLYSKKRFDIVYDVLRMYKDVYGDLMVPQVFVVPSAEPWPEESWGLKLGARVNAIRSQGALIASDPERRERLNSIGFIWELPQAYRKRKKSETLLDEAVGDENESKPKKTKKTDIVGDDNNGVELSSEKEERDKLFGNQYNMPGRIGTDRSTLAYDPSTIYEPVAYREIAAEAVRVYMQDRELSSNPDIRDVAHFEGHLTPQEFNKAITRPIPDDAIAAMKNIGYKILEFGPYNWADVQDALQVYKSRYGTVDVPLDYVVDAEKYTENIGYDEKYEGLLLGEAMEGIRTGDIDGLEDPERRQFLDDIGFDWGDMEKYQRYRFVPMIMGLRLFKHLNSYSTPEFDFVVPDEPQWPYWMVNMPLGKWAAIARIQQKMLNHHYPQRKDMLNALGFMWWYPVDGIEEKYFDPVF